MTKCKCETAPNAELPSCLSLLLWSIYSGAHQCINLPVIAHTLCDGLFPSVKLSTQSCAAALRSALNIELIALCTLTD